MNVSRAPVAASLAATMAGVAAAANTESSRDGLISFWSDRDGRPRVYVTGAGT
jgi:hypothetical protein